MSGLWDAIIQFFIEITRQIENRAPAPSYAIIDSQSVKTDSASEDRGILMAAKKIKGRKRHIVVETLGNLLSVVAHAANMHDTKAGILAAEVVFRDYPKIRGFCADAGYWAHLSRKSKKSSI